LDFILALVFFGLFLLIVAKSSFFSLKFVSKKEIIVALFFRLAVSVLFFLVYTWYYKGRDETDMYRYYDDALVMHSALTEAPSDYLKMLSSIGDQTDHISNNYYMKMNTWHKSYDYFVRNDNRTMVRINAFFMLFSFGSLYVHKLFFMILGFIGFFWIFKTITSESSLKNRILFYSVMFFPSLVFWTASITKEALLVFALGGFLYMLKRVTEKPWKPVLWILLAVFLYVLISVKIYVLLCLIPVILALIWARKSRRPAVLFKFLIVMAAYVALLWNFHHIVPGMNFLEAFVRKQHDFIYFARSINAGSLIDVEMLTPHVASFIKSIPLAFLTLLFRPFFFDAGNVFMVLVSFENLFFILFLVVIILSLNRKLKPDSMFWACVFFSLFFFAVIGLATPVLGAVVRYKIIGYPFMFAALVSLTCDAKIKRIFQMFNKKQSS
jgi:hypothetical protein